MYSPMNIHDKKERKRMDIEMYQKINDKKQIALAWKETIYSTQKRQWSYYNLVHNQTAYKRDKQSFSEWEIIEGTDDTIWYFQHKYSGMITSWDELDPRGFAYEDDEKSLNIKRRRITF